MALIAGIIIINTVLFGTVYSNKCSSFEISKDNLNKALIGHSVLEVNDKNHHDCARTCMSMSVCKSFDFDRNEHVCKLNDVDQSSVDPSEFKTKGGAIFSDISEWPSSMVGSCSSRPCKANQRCYQNGASHVCKDITCAFDQKIENGEIQIISPDKNKFLDVAQVKCDKGYVPSQQEVKCEASGKWQPATCTKEKLNIGCYCTESSHLYNGTKSTTWNGKKCQRWDVQSPHNHSIDLIYDFPDASLTAAENYCRNPNYDGDEPWCYTLDPNERYTTCGIPQCSSCQKPNIGCYNQGDSRSYNGTKNTTWNGKKCQRWDEQSPHNHTRDFSYDFPDASLTAAENYCRNPDHDGDEPWCYTLDPNERFTTCGVPQC
ncbi:plasminogen-like isoform X2 [Ruditapes philippinarum]|uniref:plasminogen-like isoform X2 n=1 Tax=Ruditapes philippinarum TaxID=129788 RepID=UPI00295C0BE8|nr:plasminogen-like isoform X2 [Ruditapes philippinarum]